MKNAGIMNHCRVSNQTTADRKHKTPAQSAAKRVASRPASKSSMTGHIAISGSSFQ